jgi:hypothetical protein
MATKPVKVQKTSELNIKKDYDNFRKKIVYVE